MNYYQSTDGKVWAFSSIQTPPEGMTAITEAAALAILNPPPTLAQAQATQIAALQAAEAAALAAGVAYNGNTYALTADMQQKITSLAAAVNANIPLTTPPRLPTIAGAFVELQNADITALAGLALNRAIALGNQLSTLIQVVMAATTVAAAQAVAWTLPA